jgi:hypothetical protein
MLATSNAPKHQSMSPTIGASIPFECYAARIHLTPSMDTPFTADRLGWRGNRDCMRIEGLIPSMSIQLTLVVHLQPMA